MKVPGKLRIHHRKRGLPALMPRSLSARPGIRNESAKLHANRSLAACIIRETADSAYVEDTIVAAEPALTE